MAVLRLCDPRLDSSTAALLDRLSTVENALRAGTPVAATTPAEAPSAPPTLGSPAVPAPPAPVTTDEPDLPPPPPPVAEESDTEQPFAAWSEVLESLRNTCPPLYGVLAGSTALLGGGKLIICTNNAMFKELFGMGNNKDLLMDAIRQASGSTYRVVLRRSEAVSKTTANDPLTQLLAAGKEAGVTVKETE
jgi:DNA polymerase-3 subunit gamma/tau